MLINPIRSFFEPTIRAISNPFNRHSSHYICWKCSGSYDVPADFLWHIRHCNGE